MVTIDDLKEIVIITHLTDDMIERLIPFVDVMTYDNRETIFRKGDIADRFYMLKRGKVLLEQRIAEKITVSVGSIKPGFSFGWSTMIEEGYYTTDAVCAEPCEIFSFEGDKIRALCEKDPYLGFLLNQRLLVVIKKRYDQVSEQFIKVIKDHPTMKSLF